jgi:hypothetical protein
MTARAGQSRGAALAELLISATLLAMVTLVTTILYKNAMATIQFSTFRVDARQVVRTAQTRLVPLLQTAYIPVLEGAASCYEKPQPPYPGGVSSSDPLDPAGPGVDSFLFYTPIDLLDPSATLVPTDQQQVRLFEVRLLTALEPDREAAGRTPRKLRNLVLRELQVPARYGQTPFNAMPGRQKTLARKLADLRFSRVASGIGLRLTAESYDRTQAASYHRIVAHSLETRIFFPVVTQ